MFSNEPTSAASHEGSRINPYEVTGLGDPQSGFAPENVSTARRTFQLRMDWADRIRFLRAVGPLRIVAVVSGVVAVLGLYTMVSGLVTLRQFDELTGAWQSAEFIARWSSSFVRVGLIVYVAWLQWRFAEAIAAAAGGRIGNMSQWSDLQLRLARWGIAMLVIGLAVTFWDTAVSILVARRLSIP